MENEQLNQINQLKQISEELFKDEEIRNHIETFLQIHEKIKQIKEVDSNVLGSLMNSFLANLLYIKKIMIIK